MDTPKASGARIRRANIRIESGKIEKVPAMVKTGDSQMEAVKRMPTSFTLPEDLVEDLRQLAKRENRPTSRQAELAIREHLAAFRNKTVAL
jgi:hypothetical protein